MAMPLPRSLPRPDEAIDADRSSFQPSSEATPWPRIAIFAAIGLAAYCIALVATIPAQVMLGDATRSGALHAVSGTIWNGSGALAGGDRVAWRWAPLRTIANFAPAADLLITGEQTDLTARARWLRPGLVLDAIGGQADASLLRAIAPRLPFTCDFTMTVDLERVAIGGGKQGIEGRILSEPGSCQPLDGSAPPIAVPALAMVAAKGAEDSRAWLAPAGDRGKRLVEATLTSSGALRLSILPAGAALLPFAAPGGQVSIETQL